MTDMDDALVGRVETVITEVSAEHEVVRGVHHVVRTGRTAFV